MNYKNLSLAFAVWLFCSMAVHAEIYKPVEGKMVDRNQLYEAHLTLHPAPEAVPALKYRLLTDPAYRVNRDANIHYLKAGGFFGNFSAQKELHKKYTETRKYRDSEDPKQRSKSVENWSDTSPNDLPLEEVKEALKLLHFQEREFEEAEKCRIADFGHKDVFEVENPFCYLLPEVQSMRSLARWQAVRCKVAIREGRIEDAIQILRQQYIMAMHLEQDLFLVSNLVGIAISGMADEDLFYLIQKPECPSLYWALAAIPRSLCNARKSISAEKRILKAYFPYHEKLCDVNSHFSEGVWTMYAEEFVKNLMLGIWTFQARTSYAKNLEERSQAAMAAFVMTAYPKAKRYLIEEIRLDRKKVDSFPAVRVVAMAVSFAMDDLSDRNAKYVLLPPEQATVWSKTFYRQECSHIKRIGMAATFSHRIIVAYLAFNSAVIRQQQNFNISQTLEALRIYAYKHDGKLPESLENLSPPAQKNPFTGEHFPYRIEDGKAVLDAPGNAGYHRRLIIEMKPIAKN